ncbi:MAG: formimidoylglutamase [Pusillimonas sp.]
MTHDGWITPDMSRWRGRTDAGEQGDTRRLFDIVHPMHPEAGLSLQAGASVLLGFACDAGVRRNQGRPGARQGPEAIRRVLANLPAHGLKRVYDAGDIVCHADGLEQAQDTLAQALHAILAKRCFPVVLGGGHEIAWGTWQGLRRHLDDSEGGTARSRVLILNLDAHFDLRTSRPASSGTPFDQMAAASHAAGLAFHYACLGVSRLGNTCALFSRASQLGVQYIEDIAMQERHLQAVQHRVQELLHDADHVYLSIDLDVLPAAVMPGVSAPAAFGVPLSVIETIVMQVRDSGKLRVADIAELNPLFDHDDQSARVAARLAYRLLTP